MGNITSVFANSKESKKRAREELPADAVIYMVPAKKARTVFSWDYPPNHERSAKLDTKTMTITTKTGKKYQNAYRYDFKLNQYVPFEQEKLDKLDFGKIFYHGIDKYTPDNHMYFKLAVADPSGDVLVYFKGGRANL